MLGTVVNSFTIILGSIMGLLIKKGIPSRLNDSIMNAISLAVVYMGVSGALKGDNPLYIIICMCIGTLIGELIDIDKSLNKLGNYIGQKITRGDENNSIAKGFVSSSLIFVVGAMAVVGALQSGLSGDHSTLFAKSVLDGISSIFFAASMGVGVVLSSIAVFLYEGTIVLCASVLSGLLSDMVITYMTSVGSLLILAIGLNMLGACNIKVANLLPSMFIPIIFGIFNIF